MIQDVLADYAKSRAISVQEALQVFFQIIVLKHLSGPKARFMGGTALVLGHGNPRFSEDVDLTQVSRSHELEPGLKKAAKELSDWLGRPVTLTPPNARTRTWRLQCPLDRAHTVRLHVDSQPYRAHTEFPIVIQFPTIPPFAVASITVDEIMADKIIAVGNRNYLGGRDLFDLWFHWLKNSDWRERLPAIQKLVRKKFSERRLDPQAFAKKLNRLKAGATSQRVGEEWRRYLPISFQSPAIAKAILESVQLLPDEFIL